MLTTLTRIARVPDLRRKLAITLGLLIAFRIGSVIPAPGVSYKAIQACTSGEQDGIAALVNLFSGGGLLKLAIFALGIMPYITASIILQLLTAVVPRLESMKKDGPNGQGKITQYTRYLTVALSTLQASAIVFAAQGSPSRLFPSCATPVLAHQGLLPVVTLTLALVGGSVLAMWIGEQITERGIGNGISLLMMTSIAAALPSQAITVATEHAVPVLAGTVAAIIALVAAVVFVEQAQRRIPITYAQKMVAGKSYGAATSYLPLKINQANVIPVIFASSLLTLPAVISQYLPAESRFARFVSEYLTSGAHPLYMGLYVTFILFFAFFYVALTYNPVETSDQIRSSGGFIPGVHPGEPTVAYLDYVLTRLTAAGAVYLAVIALLPLMLLALSGGASQMPLGGTSLLILVGVGLETVKQLDAQLQQRHYPGFLSSSS